MYSRKSRLIMNLLLAFLLTLIFVPLSSAAERRLGAMAAAQANSQASVQAATRLGGTAVGPGSDLRRIAGERQPQTFTGFPDGTLPGGGGSGGSAAGGSGPELRTVMSGEPLPPVIGPELAGSKLDRLSSIASHLGYSLVRVSYSPNVMDTPYTYALMNGGRRVSTLYFNRSMALVFAR